MSFGKVALKAVENITDKRMHPSDGWQNAAEIVFPINCTCIKKGCPKNAFLGLCNEGLVKGVEKGNYTKSELNRNYAIKAVEILKQAQKKYKPKELWVEVLRSLNSDISKVHNSQMDVVLALWGKGLIL